MDKRPEIPTANLAPPSVTTTVAAGRPLVTEIQRFSVQDGPGIRTTIFLKGCPLKCPWCHNPETQERSQQFYYYASRCVGCGQCAEVCPTGASRMIQCDLGRPVLDLDRSKCVSCMRCVAVCLTEARQTSGQEMSIEDILREALSDKLFYKNSGGGVTISGGDPLLFPSFVQELAQRLKAEGVHVAIETSCFPKQWSVIESLLSYVDLFIVDLKSLDAEKHLRVVGWPLDVIIRNIESLIRSKANLRIHIPVIPGFNDTSEDFDKYIEFLGAHASALDGVDILNYHCYGEGKYDALGRGDGYAYKGVEAGPATALLPLAAGLKKAGIASVTIGGLVGIGAAGATNRA